MPDAPDFVSVAQAATELGLTPAALRHAIMRGLITPTRLDQRTNLIPRSEIERYRRNHLRKRGPKGRRQPAQPAE